VEPADNLKAFGFYDSVPEPATLDFEKTKLMAVSQRFVSGIDTMSVCQFTFHTWTIFSFGEFMDAVNAATGWNYSLYEFMLLGERRINMMKVFNQREGFDEKDDVLPERLFEDGLVNEGRGKGRKLDRANFFARRAEYYGLNGWDPETGRPTAVKLKELGLGWLEKGGGRDKAEKPRVGAPA
jgi:aldehyde:ferredoxin oxidoreductase